MTGNTKTAIMHRKFYYFLEYMIWFISRRKILKRLNDERWFVPEARLGPSHITTGEDYARWDRGIKRETFEDALPVEMYRWGLVWRTLTNIYIKLRPRYTVVYSHRVKDILDESIREGYLLPQREGRLTLSDKGEEIIRWYYYPKMFLGNKYVEWILTKIVFPALAIWIFLHFFNINITDKLR